MYKKIFYLSCFIFVLGLASINEAKAQDQDPNLVGWWKLDETSGFTAADSSGYGYNGIVYGGADWVPGKIDGALGFDGEDDYVDLPIGSIISSLTDSTFAVWANFANPDGDWQRLWDIGTGTTNYMFLSPCASPSTTGPLRFAILGEGDTGESLIDAPSTLPSGWHHVAVVIDGASRNMQLYLDADVVASGPTQRLPADLGQTTQNWLGRSQWAADAYYYGSLDDFRIYNRVLTAEGVDMLVPRYSADKPQPSDSGVVTTTTVTLSWRAGQTTDTHHVYVGENPEDVENGTGGTDKGVTDMNTYLLENLEAGKTYYWRVDEIEADGVTVYTGAVWSFTVSGKIASSPVPANGMRFIDLDVSLTWTAGAGSIQHHVYFGDDLQDVQAGTADTDKGIVETAVFVPGTLEYGKTYYWRADEFDGQDTYTGEVWSFRTMPEITITDPNLVGWWKLDEGEGTTALDWSGNENHGAILGGAEWIVGYDGGALLFDGQDDYVELPIGSLISSLTDSTFAIWANFDNQNGNWSRIWDFGNNTTVNMFLTPAMGATGTMRFAMTISGNADEDQTTAPDTLAAGWHHVTVTFDPTNTTHTLYLDGEVTAENTAARYTPSSLGVTTQNWLGRSQYTADTYYPGALDDFRIYNNLKTQVQIQEIMRGDPLPARDPKPANTELTDLERALPLSWSLGQKAVQHDVYFGTDALIVEAADTSDTMGIYRGRQDPNTYTPPEDLIPGQTYFWRIDEVNNDATISKGRVWSFTVADYLIVDDFEDYDDVDNRIYNTWGDYFVNNTGMTVGYLPPTAPPYAEQTIVHGGSQSMYMRYDNDGTVNEDTNYEQIGTLFYSEAEKEWANPQDWTRKGVNALTLWFRGLPGSLGSFTDGSPIIMTGVGTDISGAADQFHFAYKQLSGSGSITAKVLSVSNTNPLAKAGVMIRQSMEPGSPHAAVIFSPAGRVIFLRRATSGGATLTNTKAGISAPVWVKLNRSGNNFSAQYSTNGTSWTAVGSSVSITMLTDVYVGLCVTSRNADAVCTAEFSDVTISPDPVGLWESQDIGIENNAPEQLYVALQDSSNNSAVVKHTDPAATTIDTWTQWNIPLTNFIGVNLQAIKKIFIGAGDRANMMPGGAGDLYIDDIGLNIP